MQINNKARRISQSKILPPTVSSGYWANRRAWDRWSIEDAGDFFSAHVHVNQREMTADRIRKMQDGIVVADLCCGTGKISYSILGLPNVSRLFSIEINPRSADIAREKIASHPEHEKSTIVVGDVYSEISNLPPLDCVVCLDALHHLPNIQMAIQLVHDKLKSGGLFIGNFVSSEQMKLIAVERNIEAKHWYLSFMTKLFGALRFFSPLWDYIGSKGCLRSRLYNEQEARDVIGSMFSITDFKSDNYHWFAAEKK